MDLDCWWCDCAGCLTCVKFASVPDNWNNAIISHYKGKGRKIEWNVV